MSMRIVLDVGECLTGRDVPEAHGHQGENQFGGVSFVKFVTPTPFFHSPNWLEIGLNFVQEIKRATRFDLFHRSAEHGKFRLVALGRFCCRNILFSCF